MQTLQILPVVGEIGDIHIDKTGAGSVTALNDILIGMGTAVGVIVCVVALIKMILALADQNAVAKQQSSLIMGVGIFLVSISQVLKSLDIEKAVKSKSNGAAIMGANILNVLASMLTWVGAVLAVMALVMLIMSIANEQAEQKVEGTRLLGISIGLLSVKEVVTTIAGRLVIKMITPETIIQNVVGFIAKTMTYVGGGLTVMAIWHVVMSVKNEDGKEREGAIRLFLTAIALFGLRGLLQAVGILAK